MMFLSQVAQILVPNWYKFSPTFYAPLKNISYLVYCKNLWHYDIINLFNVCGAEKTLEFNPFSNFGTLQGIYPKYNLFCSFGVVVEIVNKKSDCQTVSWLHSFTTINIRTNLTRKKEVKI